MSTPLRSARCRTMCRHRRAPRRQRGGGASLPQTAREIRQLGPLCQDKTAHLKTEFGFDTLQVAKNRYAPEQYHDFIGFQVSEPLIERAFRRLRGGSERRVNPRRLGHRLLPVLCQPPHSTHDPGGSRHAQEGPDPRVAGLCPAKVSLSPLPFGLRREWGKTYAGRVWVPHPLRASAVGAKNWPFKDWVQ